MAHMVTKGDRENPRGLEKRIVPETGFPVEANVQGDFLWTPTTNSHC